MSSTDVENDTAAFSQRLASIQARIAAACERSGRDPATVRLLPVSKTVSLAAIHTAIDAGCTMFGENRVQEAMHKAESIQDPNVRWSVIGHLQTNKARFVARFAHEVQSLDSEKLARVLDRNLQKQKRQIDVFVQVNSSFESSKYGLAIEAVPAFVQSLDEFPNLRFCGLMTLAIFDAKEEDVRACFQRMSTLRDELRQSVLDDDARCDLSMGMSGDFEMAIEEGADVVRVGQALFGPRGVPDSHYWPGLQTGAQS